MTRRAMAREASAGFTLAEAVVSLGLFAISMLGLNLLLVSTMRSNELTRDLATARFLAVQRMEQVLGARYLDGNGDAFLDPADPCADIDEITSANFPTEDYGEVDLLNGTRFVLRRCASVGDIKLAASPVLPSDYAGDAQGKLDRAVNRDQYARFRREVYLIDTADHADVIVNVTLDGPAPDGLDNVQIETTAPAPLNPGTNYTKHVLVRVKWKDIHNHVHAMTLSSAKSYLIPAS